MKLIDIIQNNAEFVKASGFTVDVQSNMDTVLIKHDSGDADQEVMLETDEGYQFIAEALKLFDELQDVTLEDVHFHLAKPYVENLA